jgi:uncharacterized protein
LKRKRWLKIIVLAYFVIGISFWLLQEKILFHNETLPADYTFNFAEPFAEMKMPAEKNSFTDVVQFFTKDSVKRGVVLYFHGNKRNILRYEMFAQNFTKHGYAVWMMDYPSFGKSTGDRTEARMNDDAQKLYQLARKEFAADSIIIYGKSLGTGIATQLASSRVCRRLILETPYLSIPDLFSSFAPIYPCNLISSFKFPNKEIIPKVIAPITIFHGTSDWTVPYSHSKKLIALCKQGDELITLEGADHNNCNEQLLMQQKLDSVLRK